MASKREHDDEPHSIRKHDWRANAVTTLAKEWRSPDTGHVHPVGTPVTAVGFLKAGGITLSVTLPSPVALYLAQATKEELAARQALREAIPRNINDPRGTQPNMSKREPQVFDGLQGRVAAVLFSYTALEAFANGSIPESFTLARQDPRTGETSHLNRSSIERHVSLTQKLVTICPSVHGVPSPKGRRIWQHFRWLKTMRDRLVHLKHSEWRSVGPNEADRWIWNHLLHRAAAGAPWYAREMLAHFLCNEPPRWLRKYTTRYRDDFESYHG